MMHNPFFSVIVPTHNGETFIRNCLRSIKTQSYRNYELLVVCDSCDDFTWEVAKRFTHPDNIYFTECHHDGLTRNKGLGNAQGDWVLFADDDDWFLHAVPNETDYTYGLLKLREQEYDREDGSSADGDTPGVTISFISFSCEVLLECLANPSNENRRRLDGEINRVVARRGQHHHEDARRYLNTGQIQM